ncbi:dnajb6-a, partial [Symbiodinium microadriaticum]
EKKCQAFDEDAWTRDMGSSQIFTGCAPCDAFLESMRKGPDLLQHSPWLKSLMSGVDPLADVDIRLPTQAGGSRQQSWIGKTRLDQPPASYVPARPHQSHTPPSSSYKPVPLQQPLLGTSNPTPMLQNRQASCMPQVTGFNPVFKQQSKGYTPPPPPDPKRKAAPASQVHVRPAPGFAGANAYAYPRFHFQHDVPSGGATFGAIPQEEDPPGSEHYRTLGLRPGAAAPEVRKAYRQLALKLHPDKQTKDLDGARFKKVTAAYKAICEILDS